MELETNLTCPLPLLPSWKLQFLSSHSATHPHPRTDSSCSVVLWLINLSCESCMILDYFNWMLECQSGVFCINVQFNDWTIWTVIGGDTCSSGCGMSWGDTFSTSGSISKMQDSPYRDSTLVVVTHLKPMSPRPLKLPRSLGRPRRSPGDCSGRRSGPLTRATRAARLLLCKTGVRFIPSSLGKSRHSSSATRGSISCKFKNHISIYNQKWK